MRLGYHDMGDRDPRGDNRNAGVDLGICTRHHGGWDKVTHECDALNSTYQVPHATHLGDEISDPLGLDTRPLMT